AAPKGNIAIDGVVRVLALRQYDVHRVESGDRFVHQAVTLLPEVHCVESRGCFRPIQDSLIEVGKGALRGPHHRFLETISPDCVIHRTYSLPSSAPTRSNCRCRCCCRTARSGAGPECCTSAPAIAGLRTRPGADSASDPTGPEAGRPGN